MWKRTKKRGMDKTEDEEGEKEKQSLKLRNTCR